jgi:hypothetical protein
MSFYAHLMEEIPETVWSKTLEFASIVRRRAGRGVDNLLVRASRSGRFGGRMPCDRKVCAGAAGRPEVKELEMVDAEWTCLRWMVVLRTTEELTLVWPEPKGNFQQP